MRFLLAALALLSLGTPAMSQSTARPNAAPWVQPFLPPAPVSAAPPFVNFDWVSSPFTVMPIQMFNWTSRPEAAFHANAAAAGFVLVVMTLAMNGLAIWLRYRLRKKLKW